MSGRLANPLRLLSFSTEPARPGTAAEAHLRGISDRLEEIGVSVERVWGDRAASRLIAVPRQHLLAFTAIRRTDVVYFRWHPLDILPIWFARALGKPYVLEVNGELDDAFASRRFLRGLRRPLVKVMRWQRRHAGAVVCVSSGLRQRVIADGVPPHRVRVIPNGADDSVTDLIRPPAAPPYAMYFGHLAARQGIQDVLTYRHNPAWPEDLSLVIAGDGPLRGLVQEHAGHGCLQYLGKLSHADTLNVIAGAQLTFSLQDPSYQRNHYMGLPIKVVESLMLGVPVIATRLSDLGEHTSAFPHCYLVEPEDKDGTLHVIAAVAKLDRSDSVRWAHDVSEALSWRALGDATLKFLEDTVLGG